MKNVLNRALAAKKKNYLTPQMETTQISNFADLCAGSGSANMIGVGGNTSASAISEGD